MSDKIQHMRLAGRHGFKSYVDLEGETDQLTAANRQLGEQLEAVLKDSQAHAERASRRQAEIESLTLALDKALSLCSEVMTWHADKKGTDYNQCDEGQCKWCAEASKLGAKATICDDNKAAIAQAREVKPSDADKPGLS